MPRSPAPKIEKLKLKHLIWSSTDHIGDSPLEVYQRFDSDNLDIRYRGAQFSYPYDGWVSVLRDREGSNKINEILQRAFVNGGVAKEDEHFPAIPFHMSIFCKRYMTAEKTLKKIALKMVVMKLNETVKQFNEMQKDAAPTT